MTPAGSGTFFVIHETGRALTAAHVVGDETEVTAKLNGIDLPAVVLGRDSDLDLALLLLPLGDYPALSLSSTPTQFLAEPAVALGFSIGGPEVTISPGTITSIRSTDSGTELQTDASVNPGASGAPLIASSGDVIGMILSTIREVGDFNIDGVNFALASSDISTWLDSKLSPLVGPDFLKSNHPYSFEVPSMSDLFVIADGRVQGFSRDQPIVFSIETVNLPYPGFSLDQFVQQQLGLARSPSVSYTTEIRRRAISVTSASPSAASVPAVRIDADIDVSDSSLHEVQLFWVIGSYGVNARASRLRDDAEMDMTALDRFIDSIVPRTGPLYEPSATHLTTIWEYVHLAMRYRVLLPIDAVVVRETAGGGNATWGYWPYMTNISAPTLGIEVTIKKYSGSHGYFSFESLVEFALDEYRKDTTYESVEELSQRTSAKGQFSTQIHLKYAREGINYLALMLVMQEGGGEFIMNIDVPVQNWPTSEAIARLVLTSFEPN